MIHKNQIALIYLTDDKYKGLTWQKAILKLAFDMGTSMPSAASYMKQLEKSGEINAEGKPNFRRKNVKQNNSDIMLNDLREQANDVIKYITPERLFGVSEVKTKEMKQ